MKTGIENSRQEFPTNASEAVKITMGHQHVDGNQFSSWTSRWDSSLLLLLTTDWGSDFNLRNVMRNAGAPPHAALNRDGGADYNMSTMAGAGSLPLVAAPLVAVLAVLLLTPGGCRAGGATVVVDLEHPVGDVDAREVSLTWDIYALRHSSGLGARSTLRSLAMRALVRELRPFVLRVSGTGCENMQLGQPAPYVPTPPAVTSRLRSGGGGTRPANVSLADWSDVTAFAVATGADLVLGLNMLLRDWPGNGSHGCASSQDSDDRSCAWIASNARAWIAHNKKVAGLHVEGYELGNEPGCFMPNVNLSGVQAGEDFAKLKAVLHSEYLDASAPVPKVIGPDTGARTTYLRAAYMQASYQASSFQCCANQKLSASNVGVSWL